MAATDLAERVDSETGELLAEEPYRFPEVRIDKKFVMLQQGRDFVLSDGLLDGLHQLSGGYFDVDTKIEQLPTGENGQTCVVSATVTVFHPEEGRVLRRASDIGDASPASVGRRPPGRSGGGDEQVGRPGLPDALVLHPFHLRPGVLRPVQRDGVLLGRARRGR